MYDWKNLLLIMAGIILNGAVFGMLMRPLIHRGKSRNSESSTSFSSDSGIKLGYIILEMIMKQYRMHV
jgi:hypothetical protein